MCIVSIVVVVLLKQDYMSIKSIIFNKICMCITVIVVLSFINKCTIVTV